MKKTYQITFKAELDDNDVKAMNGCFYQAMKEAMDIDDVYGLKLEETLTTQSMNNLKVCAHCLAAIQSREGYQPTVPVFVDEDDDVTAHTCDWCGESGFDTLYEFI